MTDEVKWKRSSPDYRNHKNDTWFHCDMNNMDKDDASDLYHWFEKQLDQTVTIMCDDGYYYRGHLWEVSTFRLNAGFLSINLSKVSLLKGKHAWELEEDPYVRELLGVLHGVDTEHPLPSDQTVGVQRD